MPENYATDDIVEIINYSYVLNTGELRYHKVPELIRAEDYKDAVVFRERPFFECYLDEL